MVTTWVWSPELTKERASQLHTVVLRPPHKCHGPGMCVCAHTNTPCTHSLRLTITHIIIDFLKPHKFKDMLLKNKEGGILRIRKRWFLRTRSEFSLQSTPPTEASVQSAQTGQHPPSWPCVNLGNNMELFLKNHMVWYCLLSGAQCQSTRNHSLQEPPHAFSLTPPNLPVLSLSSPLFPLECS